LIEQDTNMLTRARSLLASNRDASQLVARAKKFSIQLPVVGKVPVPPPDQLAFYGALGALAAVGLIDWPVALAIGAGQAVVARHFGNHSAAQATASSARDDRAAAPAKAAAPARKTAARKTAPRKAAPRKTAPRKAATTRRPTKA
jgi:hypothetical protein